MTYRLHPLTAGELAGQFSLLKALQIGSLPSVYLEESAAGAQARLRSYVETYLKEGIEVEAQLRNIGSFLNFLTIAAGENGNIINFSNIARETGTSYQTVKSYFQILEDTLIGQFIFPFQKSLRKRLSQHPKFIFFDTGVVRALTKKLTVPLEPKTTEFGRSFEHFVLLEIMRQADYQDLDYTFSFYRTESGAEVDLIVETPAGGIIALEIKATVVIDASHLRGLTSFAAGVPQARLGCVSLAPHRRQLGAVTILPWQEVFDWLKS